MSHPGRQLSALVDGELGVAERDRVLAHLARCEPCRQEAMALRALKQRMTALGEATAGSDLMQRLLAMTPPAGAPAPAALSRTTWRRAAAVVAMASSLAVAGFTVAAFLAGGSSTRPTPTVTPAMDVFMLQHAITPGTAPLAPARLTHTGAP